MVPQSSFTMTDCIEANCTVMTGSTTNGTLWIGGYDPNAPVPHWHQHMELATICIFNSLTLIVIVTRIGYRWSKLKQFKNDDRCMAVAGVFLIPYTASQIGTNVWGSGLHMVNIPDDWLEWHWHYTPGWAGFYIVTSFIKLSVCLCFIEILPQHLKAMRYSVYGLCGLVLCLGITMTFSWLFECTPFLSNFVWSIQSSTCINYDIFRWLWVGLSIPIDCALLSIPWRLLKRSQLQAHERRVLKSVFSATLLGTMTCILGIYGVWENRTSAQVDSFYQETIFLMLNDIEIFMYTLGASFPVLSRYLVARSASRHSALEAPNSNFSSWARRVPDLFKTVASPRSRQSRQASMMAHTNLEEPSFTNPYSHSDSSRSEVEKPREFGFISIIRFDEDKRRIGDEELG